MVVIIVRFVRIVHGVPFSTFRVIDYGKLNLFNRE